jgi:subtilase family serine protease
MTWRKGALAAFVVFSLVMGVSRGGDARQTQKVAVARADLVVEGVRISPTRVNNMNNATLTFTVRNRGTAAAASSFAAYYLSNDYNLSDDDRRLGSKGCGDIGRGESEAVSTFVIFPLTIAPGPYFIIVKADDTSRVFESDKANNIASAALTVIPHIPPDLRLEILSVEPSRQVRGGIVRFRYRVNNDGEGTVSNYKLRSYYSEDRVITPDDQAGTLSTHGIILEARSTGRESFGQITIPMSATPGDRYVGAIVDPGNEIPESSETNNSRSFPIFVMSEGLPDLTIATLRVRVLGVRFSVGDEISIFCRVENRGSAAASKCAVNYYLSDELAINRSTRYLGGTSMSTRGTLAAGAGFDFNYKPRIPAGVGPGDKYLLAIVDSAKAVTEQNENNNQAHFAVKIVAKK